MNITFRPSRVDELDECIKLTRNSFAFQKSEHSDLLKMWRYLLVNEMAVSAVVLDSTNPADAIIVGFGMSVFPTDEFVALSRKSLPPYIARNLLQQWKQGPSHLPLLNASQIRKANSCEGLNVAVIHRGWENVTLLGNADVEYAVGPKLYESFIAMHVGFRINTLQVEVYGETDRSRLSKFGFECATDYRSSVHLDFPVPPIGLHPYLMEANAADMLSKPYHSTTQLFIRHQVNIWFSSSEQKLLQMALLGETDKEASQALNVALSTIHKRWRRIFDRVSNSSAAIFATTGGEVRGPEKRNALLRYLRDHPEELRPVIQKRQATNLAANKIGDGVSLSP